MPEPPEVITDQHGLAGIEPAWRRLAARQSESSYFISPDWILAWHETFADGAPVEVAVWRGADGSAEAVVPLLHERHHLHRRLPLKVACPSNLGSGLGSADHCGWAVQEARRPDVREWLADRGRGGLLLRNLDPDTGGWSVPTGAVRLDRTACPRLLIPADPEAAGSAKFRKKLRWYARKVAAAGITFRWLPPGEVTEDVVDDLLRLHGMRASAIARLTSFTERRRDLHVRLVKRAEAGVGPAAVVGERSGRPVAILYGFRWRDTFAYYQTGWDPELAELSLGTVLVQESIKYAAADGARIFDFLRGAEAYKYRFGATDRHDETWLVPRRGARLLRTAQHLRGLQVRRG